MVERFVFALASINRTLKGKYFRDFYMYYIKKVYILSAIIPIISATLPAIGLLVASTIAGKVITDRVTYGT